jgi:hypothetical protein
MQKRIQGTAKNTKIVTAENSEQWESDGDDSHYMVLDVDATKGRGPETVTFHRVPPGTYQVAVDEFEKHKDGTSKDIRVAHPTIRIYLGGNQVKFKCTIPDDCQSKAAVWKAVDIKIEKAPQEDQDIADSTKYRIRLIDGRNKEKMTPLNTVSLPSLKQEMDVSRWIGMADDGHTSSSDMKWKEIKEPFYRDGQQDKTQEYSEAKLKDVCHGICEPLPNSAGFTDCLMAAGEA